MEQTKTAQVVAQIQSQCNIVYFPGTILTTKATTGDFNPLSRTKVYSNGTVDPLTNSSDIALVKKELLEATGKYGLRNYTIFTLAINTGLRCGDLIRLKVSDFFNADGNLLSITTIKESKTTKLKTFKLRNGLDIVLKKYYSTLKNPIQNQYLFPSQKSPHNNNLYVYDEQTKKHESNIKYIAPDDKNNTHITRNSFGNILNNEIQTRLSHKFSKSINLNTHSGRKTFARNYYDYAIQLDKIDNTKNSTNKSTHEQHAITMLMGLLNHSSITQTLKYIGITKEMQMEVYSMEMI